MPREPIGRNQFQCPNCGHAKGFRFADTVPRFSELPQPICLNCRHKLTKDEIKNWLNDYFRLRG